MVQVKLTCEISREGVEKFHEWADTPFFMKSSIVTPVLGKKNKK